MVNFINNYRNKSNKRNASSSSSNDFQTHDYPKKQRLVSNNETYLNQTTEKLETLQFKSYLNEEEIRKAEKLFKAAIKQCITSNTNTKGIDEVREYFNSLSNENELLQYWDKDQFPITFRGWAKDTQILLRSLRNQMYYIKDLRTKEKYQSSQIISLTQNKTSSPSFSLNFNDFNSDSDCDCDFDSEENILYYNVKGIDPINDIGVVRVKGDQQHDNIHHDQRSTEVHTSQLLILSPIVVSEPKSDVNYISDPIVTSGIGVKVIDPIAMSDTVLVDQQQQNDNIHLDQSHTEAFDLTNDDDDDNNDDVCKENDILLCDEFIRLYCISYEKFSSLDLSLELEISKKFNNKLTIIKNKFNYIEIHDLQKLQPKQWINNYLINYYVDKFISHDDIKNYIIIPSNITEIYMTDTIENKKIINLLDKDSKKYYKDNFTDIKDYLRYPNSTSYQHIDKLIFIINESNQHWLLCLVELTTKNILFYDSIPGNKNISRSNNMKKVLDKIFNMSSDDLKKFNLILYGQQSLTQDNNYDCGLYAMKNIDLALFGKKYNKSDIQKLRELLFISIIDQAKLVIKEYKDSFENNLINLVDDNISNNQQNNDGCVSEDADEYNDTSSNYTCNTLSYPISDGNNINTSNNNNTKVPSKIFVFSKDYVFQEFYNWTKDRDQCTNEVLIQRNVVGVLPTTTSSQFSLCVDSYFKIIENYIKHEVFSTLQGDHRSFLSNDQADVCLIKNIQQCDCNDSSKSDLISCLELEIEFEKNLPSTSPFLKHGNIFYINYNDRNNYLVAAYNCQVYNNSNRNDDIRNKLTKIKVIVLNEHYTQFNYINNNNNTLNSYDYIKCKYRIYILSNLYSFYRQFKSVRRVQNLEYLYILQGSINQNQNVVDKCEELETYRDMHTIKIVIENEFDRDNTIVNNLFHSDNHIGTLNNSQSNAVRRSIYNVVVKKYSINIIHGPPGQFMNLYYNFLLLI